MKKVFIWLCVFMFCAVMASAEPQNSQKLVNAAAKGNLKKVTKLLNKKNIDVNSFDAQTGDSAFMIAVANHHWDVANLLLSKGANPYQGNFRAQNAFMQAIWHEDTQAAKELLEAGMSPDWYNEENGRSVLFDMVDLNNGTERVKFLLEHGANPNLQDIYGNTPLHNVLNKSRYSAADPEKVKLLVENGAKLDIYNKKGFSPLYYASLSAALEKPKCIVSLMHPDCEPIKYDKNAPLSEKGKLVEYLKKSGAPALTKEEQESLKKDGNKPEILK